MPNEQQQGKQEEFLHALEEALGIKHTPVSLSELWEKTAPEQAGGKSLTDYMEKVRCYSLGKALKANFQSRANGSTSMMVTMHTMISGRSTRRNSEREYILALL